MLTLSQVLAKLASEKGITKEFLMDENGTFRLQDSEKEYGPSDLKIAHTYRFEGNSDPDDNAILYVIEDNSGNKGIVIDSYGAESNYPEKWEDFMRAIPVDENEDYKYD